MWKVTFEICPPDRRQKRTIATLEVYIRGAVSNTTWGEMADYNVELKDENGCLLRTGLVDKHVRSLGPLPLVLRAIESIRRGGHLPLAY